MLSITEPLSVTGKARYLASGLSAETPSITVPSAKTNSGLASQFPFLAKAGTVKDAESAKAHFPA